MTMADKSMKDVPIALQEYAQIDNPLDIKKGHVLWAYHHYNKSLLNTTSYISTLFQQQCNPASVRASIFRVVSKYKVYCKNLKTGWNLFIELCSETFTPPHTKPNKAPGSSTPNTSHNDTDTQRPSLSLTVSPIGLPPSDTSYALRNDCEKCPRRRQDLLELQIKNAGLHAQMTEKEESFNRQIRAAQRKARPGRFREVIERNKERIQKLKVKLTAKKDTNSIEKYPHKCNDFTRRLDQRTIRRLREEKERSLTEIASLKEELKCERERCQLLENKVLVLEEQLKEEKERDLTTKENSKFSPHIRKIVYKHLETHVAVNRISDLMQYTIQTTTGKALKELPSRASIGLMTYELSVLSDLQCAFFLTHNKNLTICWDATSFKGHHINSIHVAGPNKTLNINIKALPGGATEDYTQHILMALSDIIHTYTLYTHSDPVETKQKVIQNLSSTLSDRAKVNSCVRRKLEEELETELIELNCNTHPLDGLAHSARQTLHAIDVEWEVRSLLFNQNGCHAADLIHAISKMRYKQGTGDPSGFIAFLEKEKLAGIIMRYVGNRLHVMFKMAGVIFTHRYLLLKYLEQHCDRKSTFRTALVADIKNQDILIQLQALGLFGKLLTGPWMRELYGNSAKRSNLEVVCDGLFTRCLRNLQQVRDSPAIVLTLAEDIFGLPLKQCPYLKALQVAPEDSGKLLYLVRSLAAAFIDKLELQLERYLTGDLADPSPLLLERTKNAPTHNIHAERTLGMMDALLRRAPNATLGFVNGKVAAILNDTLAWIEAKAPEDQGALINFAMKRAGQMRRLNIERRQACQRALQKKSDAVRQKRDKIHRNKVEKEVKAAMKEDGMEASVFEGMADHDREVVRKFVEGVDVVGTSFLHVWNDEGKDTVFNESVRAYKIKRGVPSLTITYWKNDSTTRADYSLPVHQLLTDVILGDVTFL